MRRYDDSVEVRRGLVDTTASTVEGPEQFVWRDRLWQVRTVIGRFLETPPWWEHPAVRGLLGDDQAESAATSVTASVAASVATLVAEREVWRVDATRGRLGLVRPDDREVRGVFDLALDTGTGRWRLVGCQD